MKKKFISAIIMVVIVVAAVSLLKIRKAQLARAKPAAVLPVVVDTARLAKSIVTLTLPAMGVVASDLSTTLSTKVSGRILKVYKQEGALIKKGDILALIDNRDLAAKKEALQLKSQGVGYQIDARQEDVKALEIALAAAHETHARTDELLKVKGASIEEFRREEANIAMISAKLSAAKNGVSTLKKSRETLSQNIKEIDALISYATITSPISGTLSKRLVMVGDLAMPGKPLFRISANRGLYLNLSLPDSLRSKEILFQGTRIPLAPKNQASSAGLVQYLAQLLDGSGVVEGQFLNVRVVIYDATDVLVPVDGLLTIDGKSFIFTFENNKVQKVPVVIKARGVEGVVVRPDLAGRCIIVAKPDILLRASSGVPVYANDGADSINNAKIAD